MRIRHIQRHPEPTLTCGESMPEQLALRREDRTGVAAQAPELQAHVEHLDRGPACNPDVIGVAAREFGEPIP